jgi:hypothetical protein
MEILCAPQRRKFMVRAKDGTTRPVPRAAGKFLGRLVIFRGFLGRVVERPRSGTFTRALVSECSRLIQRRRDVEAERRRRAAESIAYLEGLEEIDALERAAAIEALERTDVQ